MKNALIITLLPLLAGFFAFNTNAQTTTPTDAEILKTWNDVWTAFQNDDSKMWSYYDENACEVYPDGTSICGLANIKAGYEQFKSMLESKPTWNISTPTVQRYKNADIVVLTSDITSSMTLKGGQKIDGKSKMCVVLHKINGQWLIVFDSQTPVLSQN
jgi:ketosteroid isomerase-like protein